MASRIRTTIIRMAGSLGLLGALAAHGQIQPMTVRTLAEGLQQPHGVAIHPQTQEIYVSELGAGRISVLRNNRPEPALVTGWRVSEDVPRWAISDEVPQATWLSATLVKPGPVSIGTNGTLFVAEQIPHGRILEFVPDEQGRYSVAEVVPVPWLDQEFQWRDLHIDSLNRLFVVGTDEIGSDFMKFGSALVRQPDGDWWVIDFGPFAFFSTFAISQAEDVMILGDRRRGQLSWWEIDRHIMLGGSPETTGRSELLSLALYPDGAFVLAQQDAPGRAVVKHLDPFSGQQTTLIDGLQSVGDIAIDRRNGRLLITDPAAGRLLEAIPNPPTRYTESTIRRIVRAVEGMSGIQTEAPAFLNNFFDRMMTAAEDHLDSTHSIDFTLSDIAGKMPIVAGRVRAAVEVEGAEDDPLEEVEFFLLFPSKVVMTDTAVTPSLSFFSARRKSGKVEQTRPLFQGDVGVLRMSGTNIVRIASAPGGLHVPIVACGFDISEGGIYVNLSFLGVGIFGDYYLTLFQGPREQTAKLVVKSPTSESGTVTYEATFIDETVVEGMSGTVTREQISNLLISGFEGGGAVNRAVGWLRIGQFPATMTVAFGDTLDTQVTGAAADMRQIVERRTMEMRLETAAEIEALDEGRGTAPVPVAPEPAPGEAVEAPAIAETAAEEPGP